MKINKIALALMATLIFAHCAQISKEDTSTKASTTQAPSGGGDDDTTPSAYNALVASHVTQASCDGHTGDGCVAGFSDSSKTVNGVRGSGWGSGSFDVYSMSESTAEDGKYATLILDWGGATVKNVTGLDFIVYENGFDNAGTYGTRFMDLIIVSVSQNNVDYCGWPVEFKGKKGTDNLASFLDETLTPDNTQYSNWPEQWVHFAGKSPVAWNIDTNSMSYDDLFSTKTTEYYNTATPPALMYSRTDLKGGGDGFDLDNLVTDAATCTTTVLNDIVTNGFKYVKLVSARSQINPATGALYPHYAISNGPDVDGVLARHVVE